jgi:hypothetical protein
MDSDDESVLNHDPLLSDANMEIPSLREELAEQYGADVFNDDLTSIHPQSHVTDEEQDEAGEEGEILRSTTPDPLSESESDDDLPNTKNPLQKLIKDAQEVIMNEKCFMKV